MIKQDITIYNQSDCVLPKSFFEGRFIPDVHPDSLDYQQWWAEQLNRCKNGWEDGGFYAPPAYYYHLNFKKINMLNNKNKPFIGHPYFAVDDLELFQEMELARKEGKGFILVTGRGWGKSYSISSICEHEFIFTPASEIIVSASTDFFAKELWFKIKLGLNSVPDEMRPNLLSDTKEYMESGIKWKNPDTGKEKIIGYRSKMHRTIYDNDAGRTRGTRPNIHVFEECLGKGTKVFMYDKSFKNVEDIHIDDLVMGVDSKPKKVVKTVSGRDNMFLVEQQKGIDYVVSSNHRLALLQKTSIKYYKKDDGYKLYTVSELENLTTYKRKTIYGIKSDGIDYKHTSNPLNTQIKTKPIGEGDYYGFTLEGNNSIDHLFMLEDLTITHNSGSWSGAAKLIDCYNQTEASWWRGSIFTSFPILIGTGGQMVQGGSEDFKIMFEDPEAFNLRAYKWEETTIGKFKPAYNKFGGFYEKTGVSDEKTAKEFLDARRKKKKKNVKSYQQELQEFPYEPAEAFMVSGFSIFDVNALYTRYAEIKKSKELQGMVDKCDLKFIRAGGKIIGVEKVLDKNGQFEILEHPKLNAEKRPMPGLYVSGCDSFDSVEEEMPDDSDGKSKGSIFIYKRFWKPSETGNIFVAKITQRTANASTFYWNTVKLNMYYGCRMLYEHTKIGIAQHYITNRLSHLLYPRPKLDQVNIKNSQSTNMYGLTMPVQIKRHMINRYSEYIDNNIDQMYFSSQVLDAMNFRWKSSKFDETMAAALAILADDDMYEVKIKENLQKGRTFPKFRRTPSGELIFD